MGEGGWVLDYGSGRREGLESCCWRTPESRKD